MSVSKELLSFSMSMENRLATPEDFPPDWTGATTQTIPVSQQDFVPHDKLALISGASLASSRLSVASVPSSVASQRCTCARSANLGGGTLRIRRVVDTLLAPSASAEALPGGDKMCPVHNKHVMELAVGDVLAQRYVILAFLKRGGEGAVYRARDLRSSMFFAENLVAIKTGKPSPIDLVTASAEAHTYFHLPPHPNVLMMRDLLALKTATHQMRVLVLDYADKGSLKDWIAARQARVFGARVNLVELLSRLKVFLEALRGLRHLHRNETVHLDFKPANVVLFSVGRDREIAKIADFGLSAIQTIDNPSRIAGTPLYMAPEQRQPGHRTTSVDMYAVGLSLIALLSGTRRLVTGAASTYHQMQLERPLDYLDRSIPQRHQANRVIAPLVRVITDCVQELASARITVDTCIDEIKAVCVTAEHLVGITPEPRVLAPDVVAKLGPLGERLACAIASDDPVIESKVWEGHWNDARQHFFWQRDFGAMLASLKEVQALNPELLGVDAVTLWSMAENTSAGSVLAGTLKDDVKCDELAAVALHCLKCAMLATSNDPSAETIHFLHLAITSGMDTVVQLYVKELRDAGETARLLEVLMEEDDSGRQPLHQAVDGNLRPLVSLFLEVGVDVNRKDQWGMYPVMYCRDLAMLELLVEEYDANLECLDSMGASTLVHMCCRVPHPDDLVDYILSLHPYLLELEDFDKRTPMFHACMHSTSCTATAALLRHRAEINTRDATGATPLSMACIAGNSTMVGLLLSSGAMPQLPSTPPLCLLLDSFEAGGRPDAMRYLLHAGADTDRGRLCPAASLDALAFLCDAAAEASSAVTRARIMVFLIKHEVAVSLFPLHRACRLGYVDEVEALSRYFVDEFKAMALTKDDYGRTPLMYACMNVHSSRCLLVDLLLPVSDVAARCDMGLPALAYAAAVENAHAVGCIARTACGQDLALGLRVAAIGCHQQLCKTLLSHGAASAVPDDDGDTALSLAEARGDQALVAVLAAAKGRSELPPVSPQPPSGEAPGAGLRHRRTAPTLTPAPAPTPAPMATPAGGGAAVTPPAAEAPNTSFCTIM